MKLNDLLENKLYKFHADENGEPGPFITNSPNLDSTTPTMVNHAKRTGKDVLVSLDGKVIGKITKAGFEKTK